MCGIAGYVCKDKYEPKLDVAFPLMGLFMEDRGNQSWGWTDGRTIIKNVGQLQESWTPTYTGSMQAALHTRYATTGAINSENSHPWDFGDGFIGMHNGVIDNDWELILEHNLPRYNVDSQLLLHYIKHRMDLSEIEGYGAVAFFRDGKLWLGRFRGGDLSIARTEFGVVFASTEWAIDNAMQMAGLPKAVHYQVDQGALYFIEDGQLFISDEKLDVGERKKTTTWQQGNVAPGAVQNYKVIGSTTHGNGDDLTLNREATNCAWCATGSRDLFDTPEGALCEGCARFAMLSDSNTFGTVTPAVTLADVIAEAASHETGVPTHYGPYEACCERASFDIICDCDNQEALSRRARAGIKESRATEYVQGDEEDLMIVFDSEWGHYESVREWDQSGELMDLPIDHPSMTSCDDCNMTLVADDEMWESNGRVPLVICDGCHTDRENEVVQQAHYDFLSQ
jgi:hypothetical protein